MKKRNYEWDLLEQKSWRIPLRKLKPFYRGIIRRIYPGTPDYDPVLLLRYEARVESGIIDPRMVKIEHMQQEKDTDNIILGFYLGGILEATLTLERPGGSLSGWLLAHSEGHSAGRKGRKGTQLLLDTARILCAGLKMKGIVGIVRQEEAGLPEEWQDNRFESLASCPEIARIHARYPEQNGYRLVFSALKIGDAPQ